MPKLLSTMEVKKITGLSLVSIRLLIKRNILRASRIGIRRWGISDEDLKAFISSRANKAPEPSQEVRE